MAVATLTPEQRAVAAVKAAEARKALQVLRAVPGFGPAKVAALMATCGVEVKQRVGGLEEAQRERLLTAFAG